MQRLISSLKVNAQRGIDGGVLLARGQYPYIEMITHCHLVEHYSDRTYFLSVTRIF